MSAAIDSKGASAAARLARRPIATPITTRASFALRWRTMARVALRMMFHDRMKLLGTLAGVVFAVVLSNQQAATFLGLVQRNVMFVDNAGADLWIVPASTEQLQPGKPLSDAALLQAKTARGVAWAEPLLYGAGTVSLPSGGSEQVMIVGTRYPAWRGGPFNVVAGEKGDLAKRDAMFFEDSQRGKLGGMNLGSVREINGHKVQAVGFTWGLVPFGPSYSFAEYDLARELLHTPSDQTSFVLVGLAPGADAAAVRREIQSRVPEARVLTKDEFKSKIVRFVIFETGIGITFGTSTAFGLLVGFVIVALSMFSAVIDNVREFGTLKAIGATTLDLVKLLWMQAVVFGALGSLVGLALVSQLATSARSAQLAMQMPPALLGGTSVLVIGMCVVASSLAALRVRAVEPAMVFR